MAIDRKICLVGDFAVGKTSLIRRFVENKFSDRYLTTVGVKISRKIIQLGSGDSQKEVRLMLWDLEGQTKFKAIAPSYLKGSKAAILVADATRQDTIEHLEDHVNLFTGVNPQGSIFVALNKSDLVTEEKLSQLRQMNQFDESKIISIYITSAKTGQYVEEMFTEIARNTVK